MRVAAIALVTLAAGGCSGGSSTTARAAGGGAGAALGANGGATNAGGSSGGAGAGLGDHGGLSAGGAAGLGGSSSAGAGGGSAASGVGGGGKSCIDVHVGPDWIAATSPPNLATKVQQVYNDDLSVQDGTLWVAWTSLADSNRSVPMLASTQDGQPDASMVIDIVKVGDSQLSLVKGPTTFSILFGDAKYNNYLAIVSPSAQVLAINFLGDGTAPSPSAVGWDGEAYVVHGYYAGANGVDLFVLRVS